MQKRTLGWRHMTSRTTNLLLPPGWVAQKRGPLLSRAPPGGLRATLLCSRECSHNLQGDLNFPHLVHRAEGCTPQGGRWKRRARGFPPGSWTQSSIPGGQERGVSAWHSHFGHRWPGAHLCAFPVRGRAYPEGKCARLGEGAKLPPCP